MRRRRFASLAPTAPTFCRLSAPTTSLHVAPSGGSVNPMQILALAPRRRKTAPAKNRPSSPISGCVRENTTQKS